MRDSSSYAYLRHSEHGKKVTIETGARVTRVELSGTRAVGVTYHRNGKETRAAADREIILSGGAFHSPQLLMLSGIGPADHLRQHGLAVHVDLPGVGENLQDHIHLQIQYTIKEPIAFNKYGRLDRKIVAGLDWFLRHKGPASSNHIEVGAFFRSRAGIEHPDVQIHFKPFLLDGWILSKEHGFNFGIGTMRATSTGSVRLESANPAAAPLIDPNYLATHEDVVDIRNAVKLSQEIAEQKAFDRFRGRALSLGDGIRTDAEIDAYIRANAGSGFHPVGTCRMGMDTGAVCTPDLRVRGVEGLRVVDASVFPDEPSANINAATFMLAERASDIILDRTLPPQPAPVYAAPDFASRQR